MWLIISKGFFLEKNITALIIHEGSSKNFLLQYIQLLTRTKYSLMMFNIYKRGGFKLYKAIPYETFVKCKSKNLTSNGRQTCSWVVNYTPTPYAIYSNIHQHAHGVWSHSRTRYISNNTFPYSVLIVIYFNTYKLVSFNDLSQYFLLILYL